MADRASASRFSGVRSQGCYGQWWSVYSMCSIPANWLTVYEAKSGGGRALTWAQHNFIYIPLLKRHSRSMMCFTVQREENKDKETKTTEKECKSLIKAWRKATSCRKGQTGVNIKINSSLKPVSKCIGTGACLSVKTHENFDVDKPSAFS